MFEVGLRESLADGSATLRVAGAIGPRAQHHFAKFTHITLLTVEALLDATASTHVNTAFKRPKPGERSTIAMSALAQDHFRGHRLSHLGAIHE